MTVPESERPLPPPPNVPGASNPQSVISGPPLPSPPASGTVPTTTARPQPQQLSTHNRRTSAHLTIPPPKDDVADDEYGIRTEDDFAPEQAIDSQIADLEHWAHAIDRLDRREGKRFWMLRSIGFLAAAGAVAGGALALSNLAITGGAIAAAAIAIDAAWPTTTDRRSRRRAIRELRELQHTLKLKWDKVRLAYPVTQPARRIAHALTLLDMAQSKREEIGKFLGDAAPGVQRTRDGI